MDLISVRKEDSAAGRVRLTGTVAYDDRPGHTEEYWFEIPSEHAHFLAESGNPWLTCLSPMAATLGEPLRIPLPVDGLLVRNIQEVMAIWKSWYSRLTVVSIVAPPEESAGGAGGGKTGLFFSGGVDAFFSLFHNEQVAPGRFPADDLIAIHGFDMLLEQEDTFERHSGMLRRVAAETGKSLITIRTNLRNTRLREASMAGLWHGCALASAGLLLEKRYDRLLLASSDNYADLTPWGSHPLTDPLLSTSRTMVLHDGAAFTRWEKLEFVSRFDVVLRSLHVCSRNTSAENCGECEKCYRNVIILDVLGVLDRCATFPVRKLDLEKVSRIFIKKGWHRTFYRDLRIFAASRGRLDVAKAINRSFRRSRLLRPVVAVADSLGRRRLVWRLGQILKRWVFAKSLR
jgi:hypothetical protein